MDTLQNMGCQTLNQIEDLCKGEQLYNPGIIRTQVIVLGKDLVC